MQSVYTKMKIKSLFLNFLFWFITITSSIIISYVLIFFILPMYKKQTIVPAQIFGYGNELSIKVQEKINSILSIYVDNIYSKVLENVHFSITLFSVMLVIFTLAFGLIYFSKIRDAENLMKEIQKNPGLFFEQFYREQYYKNISSLFSKNYITRYSAINNLTFNPEINAEDYDVLREVLLNELNYTANIYLYQNISTITSILTKINYEKTVLLLRNILKEQKYDTMKHNHLLPHIIADKSPETVVFIKELLLSNNEMVTQLVSLLASNGSLNDYIDHILEKCDGSVLHMVINMSYSEVWHIDTTSFSDHILKRDDIDNQCLHSIISHKSINSKDKITLILHFYLKNPGKFDLPLNNLISTISADENAKQQFLLIAENIEYKELIQAYFVKNDHQISHFANFQDSFFVKSKANEKRIECSSDIIKKHDLRLSEDGVNVIEKNGEKYKIEQYCRSGFGYMSPVKSGIILNGTFIDIDELKK